jgi:hypothetical protein
MTLKRRVWRKVRQLLPVFGEEFAAPSVKQALIDQEIRALRQDLLLRTPDNPALQGFKVFGQVDEDGIIEQIFTRIGASKKTFIELGCGNGTENNTHYLALKGWSGVWVDGSDDNIAHISQYVPPSSKRLHVQKMFITRENIAAAAKTWMDRFGAEFDLLSIDIDGNDAAVLGEIMTVMTPRVLVVEYNGKFPPPLKLSVAYNPSHTWARDDYFGSTLQVFVDLLKDYRLVSCGVAGINAFFVRNDLASGFATYTTEQLFMFARNHLIHRRGAAVTSLKHLQNVISS